MMERFRSVDMSDPERTVPMGSRMKSRITFVGIILVVTVACDKSVEPEMRNVDSVYFNSFESSEDTVGWWGYGAIGFWSDAPPNGGKQSLYVSGGCIVPHATVDLNAMMTDSYIILRCWGKNLAIGGGVSLKLPGDVPRSISIVVVDTAWKSYVSPDTLFCPANQSIRLSLAAGGIAPSAMLVDLVEVIRVR